MVEYRECFLAVKQRKSHHPMCCVRIRLNVGVYDAGKCLLLELPSCSIVPRTANTNEKIRFNCDTPFEHPFFPYSLFLSITKI